MASRLGKDSQELIEEYYIGDITLERDSIQLDNEVMEAFFSDPIKQAVTKTQTSINQKYNPAFFSISDGSHFVLIALVPHIKNPKTLSKARKPEKMLQTL